MKRKFKH